MAIRCTSCVQQYGGISNLQIWKIPIFSLISQKWNQKSHHLNDNPGVQELLTHRRENKWKSVSIYVWVWTIGPGQHRSYFPNHGNFKAACSKDQLLRSRQRGKRKWKSPHTEPQREEMKVSSTLLHHSFIWTAMITYVIFSLRKGCGNFSLLSGNHCTEHDRNAGNGLLFQ